MAARPSVARGAAWIAMLGIGWSIPAGSGWAQAPGEEGEEFRVFTNKEGKSIDARIVAVAPDRRTLTIALRDGKEATLPIVMLSLDDQQYLREWIEVRPISSTFHVQVEVEKFAARPADRRRSFSYRLITDHVSYRIRVRNLSRETMAAPVVEYFVLAEENIRIESDPDSGNWTFNGGGGFEAKAVSVREVKSLPDLPYNREQELITSPVEIDQVIDDGNDVYGEDRLIGAIVQVRDQNGNVAGVWRSSDSGVAKLEWNQVARPGAGTGEGEPEGRRAEASQGGSIPAGELDLAGRPFLVRARIAPAPDGQGGVIAAQGDEAGGWQLRIAGRRATFAVLTGGGRTRQVSAALPGDGDSFRLAAELTADRMELFVDDESIGEATSPGFFETSPAGPITVGYAPEGSIAGPGGGGGAFDGTIEDFLIRVGPKAGQEP